MVEWATADQPAGVEVVRFQILVINGAAIVASGNQTLSEIAFVVG